MVYTVVLEATAARIESSSLSLGTKITVDNLLQMLYTCILKKVNMKPKQLDRTQNDTDLCVRLIGNRFNLVLVAATRVRELRRGSKPLVDNANHSSSVVLALKEIEQGKVGVEYLKKIR